MGLTKSILFDKNPAHDAIRKEWAEDAWREIRKYKVRIPTRRKRVVGKGWCSLWEISLSAAANELGIKSVNVNAGMMLLTEKDGATVKERAEVLWRELLTRHGYPVPPL